MTKGRPNIVMASTMRLRSRNMLCLLQRERQVYYRNENAYFCKAVLWTLVVVLSTAAETAEVLPTATQLLSVLRR